MKNFKLSSLFLLLYLFAGNSYALNEEDFFTAQNIFFKARAGSSEAIQKAQIAFAKLNQKDPVVMAYNGALKALEAREAWMPWNKINLAEEGLDIIDKALKKGGESKKMIKDARYDILIRVVAASVMADLPDIFKRRQQAIDLHQELLELEPYANKSLKKHIAKIGKVIKKKVKK
jgi:hypothetical protein